MPDPRQEFVLRHGFDEKRQYVALPDAVRLGKMGVGRQEDHGCLVGPFAHGLYKLQAVHLRQFHIHDQTMTMGEQRRSQGIFGRVEFGHLQTMGFQEDANGMTNGFVTIDHADIGPLPRGFVMIRQFRSLRHAACSIY